MTAGMVHVTSCHLGVTALRRGARGVHEPAVHSQVRCLVLRLRGIRGGGGPFSLWFFVEKPFSLWPILPLTTPRYIPQYHSIPQHFNTSILARLDVHEAIAIT
jgi:hypothetical protein